MLEKSLDWILTFFNRLIGNGIKKMIWNYSYSSGGIVCVVWYVMCSEDACRMQTLKVSIFMKCVKLQLVFEKKEKKKINIITVDNCLIGDEINFSTAYIGT